MFNRVVVLGLPGAERGHCRNLIARQLTKDAGQGNGDEDDLEQRNKTLIRTRLKKIRNRTLIQNQAGKEEQNIDSEPGWKRRTEH